MGSERSAAEEGMQEGNERTRLDAGERAASLGTCVEQDVAPTDLALDKLASSNAPGRGERTMHTAGDTATGTLVEVGVAPVEVGVAQRASSPATTGAQDSPMEEEGACPGTGHRKSLHDRLPSLLRDLASSYEGRLMLWCVLGVRGCVTVSVCAHSCDCRPEKTGGEES